MMNFNKLLKKDNLLHFGLQRSGTNFLSKLLVQNFNIKILNRNKNTSHPLQKHFRLYDEKNIIPHIAYKNNLSINNLDEYITQLKISKPVKGIIIISKDPYSWLLSYKAWAKKCNWPKVDHHYIKEYNLFYDKWFKFAEKNDTILFIKYIDLLSQTNLVLEDIEKKFQLTHSFSRDFKGITNKINKVPQSDKFNSDKINYYVNKEFLQKYDKAELKEINTLLNKNLMYKMNYEVIDKIQ